MLLQHDHDEVADAIDGERRAESAIPADGAGILGIEESSLRALTKIVQVMPPRLRHQVDAIAQMPIPAA